MVLGSLRLADFAKRYKTVFEPHFVGDRLKSRALTKKKKGVLGRDQAALDQAKLMGKGPTNNQLDEPMRTLAKSKQTRRGHLKRFKIQSSITKEKAGAEGGKPCQLNVTSARFQHDLTGTAPEKRSLEDGL